MKSLPPSLLALLIQDLDNASRPKHEKKLTIGMRMRDDFLHPTQRARTRLVDCIIRLLESSNTNTYGLKQIGYIFGMDPSLVERQFRKAKGTTVKAYLDKLLRERLIVLLAKGRWNGYECASALGFQNDDAFYHWVKRVFGETFRQLRAHGTTRSWTELGAGSR